MSEVKLQQSQNLPKIIQSKRLITQIRQRLQEHGISPSEITKVLLTKISIQLNQKIKFNSKQPVERQFCKKKILRLMTPEKCMKIIETLSVYLRQLEMASQAEESASSSSSKEDKQSQEQVKSRKRVADVKVNEEEDWGVSRKKIKLEHNSNIFESSPSPPRQSSNSFAMRFKSREARQSVLPPSRRIRILTRQSLLDDDSLIPFLMPSMNREEPLNDFYNYLARKRNNRLL